MEGELDRTVNAFQGFTPCFSYKPADQLGWGRIILVLIYRLGKVSPEGIMASIRYLVEGEMTSGPQGF